MLVDGRGPLVQKISVPFEYLVYFSPGVFDPDNADLADALSYREPHRRHRFLAIIDRGVAGAWPDLAARIAAYADRHAGRIELVDEPMLVAGGEAIKNEPLASEMLGALWGAFDARGIDRHSFVVAVGGGALLDMAGYAAATTHRGVRMVRVPTTVLAQADSAVGVKNGVNLRGKKNFIGTFAPPFAVLVDSTFLKTLSRRDTVAGMAEAVKVALIRDADFFSWLVEHARDLHDGDAAALDRLVRRSAELHLAHIATSGDPFEMGSARPLDFGHWAAHKLETLTDHRLRHGEAVAIGLALDTIYSACTGLCDAATETAVLDTLRRLGFALWDEALDLLDEDGRPRVLEGVSEFREHLGGELSVTLLQEVGRGIEVHELSEPVVLAAMARLRAEARA